MQRLTDAEIEERLVTLLADHPEATVLAIDPTDVSGPHPDHPGLAGLPVDPNTVLAPLPSLELLHPSSRPIAMTAIERVGETGVVIDDLTFADGRPAVSFFFDLMRTRKLYIGVQIDGTAPAEGAAVRTRELVPGRVTHLRTDDLGRVLWIDEETYHLLAETSDEVIGTFAANVVHPDDLTEVRQAWAAMLVSPGQPHRMRHRRAFKDGWRWFEATIVNRLDDPVDPAVHFEMVDISGEMAAQDEVRRRERLLHRLAEAMPQAIIQLDPNGGVVYANELANDMVGTNVGDQPGTIDALIAAVDPIDRDALFEAIDAALGGQDGDVELRLTRPDGEVMVAEIVLRGLSDDDDNPDGALCCISDVTERARLRENLEMRATFDPLTGLYNRDSVLRALADAVDRGDDGPGVALIFVDLDGFKAVNDQRGHAVGDDVLRAVANHLASVVRGRDIVGRIGGDEFLVVCHEVAEPVAARAAGERVAAALSTARCGESLMGVSASIGVAWSGGAETAEVLMARADAAMYEAKRNQVGLVFADLG